MFQDCTQFKKARSEGEVENVVIVQGLVSLVELVDKVKNGLL